MDIETIILAVIFIILFVVSYKALSQIGNFSGFPRVILSVCVAILAVIGMKDSLNGETKTVLLPYAALGISVLILLILLFVGKYLAGAKEHFGRRIDRQVDRRKSRENRNFIKK